MLGEDAFLFVSLFLAVIKPICRRFKGVSVLINGIIRMRLRDEDKTMEQEKTEIIRSQNDRFRKGLPDGLDVPGRVVITSGVQSLTNTDAEPAKLLPLLCEAIRTFDDFSSDNDPYLEHDFGAFDFEGERIFWKLDYYAPNLMHGSEDPADLKQTVRVLTIMLASEY